MSVFEAPSTEAPWPSEAEQVDGTAEAFEGETGEMEARASELESPFRSAMTFGETEGAAYPEAQRADHDVARVSVPVELQRGLRVRDHRPRRSASCSRSSRASSSTRRLRSWSTRPPACISRLAPPGRPPRRRRRPGDAELEAWIEPLRQETHRMLDNMAERLGNEELETLRELRARGAVRVAAPGHRLPAGGVRELPRRPVPQGQVARLECGQARQEGRRRGVEPGQAGRRRSRRLLSLPLKFLLGRLKTLAGALLRGVLQKAIGLLPASVQPIARHARRPAARRGRGRGAGRPRSEPGAAVRHSRGEPDAGRERSRGGEHR